MLTGRPVVKTGIITAVGQIPKVPLIWDVPGNILSLMDQKSLNSKKQMIMKGKDMKIEHIQD